MDSNAKYRSLDTISDSEEEVHPNIDTKSYRKFIKEERKRRLDFLRSKNNLTEEENRELKKLEYKELPLLVEVEDNFRINSDKNNFIDKIIKSNDYTYNINEDPELNNTDITNNNTNITVNNNYSSSNQIVKNEDLLNNNTTEENDLLDEKTDKSINILFSLLENNTVENFIKLMDNEDVDLNTIENLVYYNLSEAIKENNDELGLEFCKIGLLNSWAIEFGRSYLLNIKENKLLEIVKEHYKKSKAAILSLKNIENE